MSSREIAELTRKEHKNVLRLVRELISGGILAAQIEPLKFEYRGQLFDYYELNKRDSFVVVARLSPEFTAAVIDRWQELESKENIQIPQTLPEALRLAADLAEEQQKLKQELAAAAPKVEFVDRYCTAKGSMTFRQVAKLLNAKETDFRLFLLEQHIMYRLNNVMTPHAHHLDAGRFEVKTGTTASSNYAFSQARFTAKGVQWIGGLWTAYKARGEEE